MYIYTYVYIGDILYKKAKQMNNLLETKAFLDLTTSSDKSLAEINLSMKVFAFDKLALFDKMICDAKASFLISFPGFRPKDLLHLISC